MAATFIPRMPLRTYAAHINMGLPSEQQVPYDKLERLASEGKLTGAYKQGRIWFIDLTVDLPEVIELSHEQEGNRNGGEDRRQVLRPLEDQRKRRVRRS